jgi:Tat protein translocase TatB subunit
LNFFGLSPGEIVLIMLVAMVVIGPEKLPETAASVGKWIREFRRVTTELTQQFSEDNPFTEIQRAFNLTDLTDSLNSPLAVTAPTAPAAVEVNTPAESQMVGATAAVTTPGAVAVAPVRSDYFKFPAPNVPVEDSWIHSGLDEVYVGARNGRAHLSTAEFVDEWAHGVPLFAPPAPVVEEPITEASSTEIVLEPLDVAPVELPPAELDAPAVAIESSSPELEYAVANPDPISVNGSVATQDEPDEEALVVGAAGTSSRSHP